MPRVVPESFKNRRTIHQNLRRLSSFSFIAILTLNLCSRVWGKSKIFATSEIVGKNLRLPAILACHILQHQRTTRMLISIPETRRGFNRLRTDWPPGITFFSAREKTLDWKTHAPRISFKTDPKQPPKF